MSDQQSRHSRGATSQSKTSWLKSKATKAFSSKPSKSSQDEGPSKFPLQAGQSQPSTRSRPISELWDEAYEELYQKDKALVVEYEAQLSKSLVGAVASAQASFSRLSKVQKRHQMKALLDQKIKEIEDGKWKMKFKDNEFAVMDLVEPVVKIIDWAKEFVGSALEPSPPGSIAWAGVCLMLPVSASSTVFAHYTVLTYWVLKASFESI
jgi:hypothetical protein